MHFAEHLVKPGSIKAFFKPCVTSWVSTPLPPSNCPSATQCLQHHPRSSSHALHGGSMVMTHTPRAGKGETESRLTTHASHRHHG